MPTESTGDPFATDHVGPPRVPDDAQVAATPDDTRREITRLSARGYLAIRHSFVQQDSKPAMLGALVRGRKHHALLLYLMILTAAPWLGTQERPLGSKVWIRALDAPGTKAPTWSPSTLSRAFADLEEIGLLEPAVRKARRRVVAPRREDGREVWTQATGKNRDLYFTIPDDFWHDGLFAKLRLPGLAMLLIIAKETNNREEMYLPFDKAVDWYGISGKTAQNGLAELAEHGLLHRRSEYRKSGLSDIGWTERIWYSLTGHYSRVARAERRLTAKTERNRRAVAATSAAEFVGEADAPEAEHRHTERNPGTVAGTGTARFVSEAEALKWQAGKEAEIERRLAT